MSYDGNNGKSSNPGTISYNGSAPLDPKLLYVITVIYNPLLWSSRISTYRTFEAAMIEAGVNLTVVECVNGDRPYQCAGTPGVTHIGVKAETLAWNKENLMNLGVSRLPSDAKYILLADADIVWRKNTWAQDTLNALQLYPVIQPWDTCYDLGPNDEHLSAYTSFAKQMLHGQPIVKTHPKFWQFEGGPHVFPHTGYAWAYRRDALDKVGGLFELGGMGSGDYHMALALANKVEASIPGGSHTNYVHALKTWQDRAVKFINYNVGFVQGTIEHIWHGRKADRQYISRWDIFLKHDFDPYTDLHKNSYGVLEFASHKPELKREFDVYLRSRNEDVNSL